MRGKIKFGRYKQTTAFLVISEKKRRRKRQQKYSKAFWIRKAYHESQRKAEFHLLVQDLGLFDHQTFPVLQNDAHYIQKAFVMGCTSYSPKVN